ncbi:MAG TPA: hypothetical protein VEU11_06915 [Terriglobales bacterium]|nr:hypothetical protein [Terriglobales bacterium]
MPADCIHEFFWPLRAADGRYYQVCRRCGTQCEYDWTTMDRVGGVPGVTLPPGISGPRPSTPSGAPPRLKLLIELEPAYRVFFRNLADVLRPGSPAEPTIWSAAFWREAFFDTDIPWQRFAETLVGQLVVVAMVLLVSQVWTSPDQPTRRSMFENTHLTYYKPEGSYPALRSAPSRARSAYRKPAESARGGSIHVAPERAQAAVKAPEIKLKEPARPDLVASNVPPEMPLAATSRSLRLPLPAGPATIVAPPPEISQGTSRRPGLLQASGVAPAPELGAVSSRRVVAEPGATVVAPAPVVRAAVRRLGDINIGPSAVVAPAPRLPVGEQSMISGGPGATLGSPVALAVPPPAAPGSGTLTTGRAGVLSGVGSAVVPPPPSVQGIGELTEGGHPGLSSRASSSTSSSSRNLSSGTFPGGPASSAGVQAVPPPPSLEGAGAGAGQRAGVLSGLGSGSGVQGVAPAPSVGAGGNSDHGGRQVAMNRSPALASAAPSVTDNPRQRAEDQNEPATQEMPLRLIGLAMALPSSSYFSNYEVYIAERRLRKNLTELVKLVYVYLPYQRRLSEYGVDNSKVYKLLVSRDRTCDESLMQMTWPEADPHPDVHNAADAPGLSAEDKKSMLPCYRTTADAYRKAISRR